MPLRDYLIALIGVGRPTLIIVRMIFLSSWDIRLYKEKKATLELPSIHWLHSASGLHAIDQML